MAASRIFIKNLPPNLKEDDFREHFSSLAPVTDAKFIPRRRIGYVGYKTPETALKAIKYFHKSFIRMSKIHVELAKSVDESQPRKRTRLQDDAQVQLSETRNQREDAAENPKLQEFLNTMAPASRGKTWANEDVPANVSVPLPSLPDTGNEEASEDEYQTISKKRKRDDEPMEVDNGKIISPSLANGSNLQEVAVTDSSTNIASQVEADTSVEGGKLLEISETPIVPEHIASDNDWLRSKTNRLLGLVNDDELHQTPSTTVDTEPLRKNVQDSRGRDQVQSKKSPPPENQPSNIKLPGVSDDLLSENSATERLFIRNLSYDTTDAELQAILAKYGSIEEIHISRDTRTGTSKGFGYARFSSSEEAQAAKDDLDGKPFQGRLLHILQAKNQKPHSLDEFELSKLPLKKQREIRRKAEASTATFKWNSMYLNPDAILSSVAVRLGVSKTDLMDPTSSDAAVRQAHAETNLIREAKGYFANHGINLDSFKGKEHGDKAILVKNFPHGTSAEELKKMFEVYGIVSRFLMPPSATIAVVEMEQAAQARSAFHSLAYRKFKDSVLLLEKAPKTVFMSSETPADEEVAASKPAASDLLGQEEVGLTTTAKATLFVRNLNFSTTSFELRDLFMPLQGFLSATVKTKTDAKKPGQTLSMGFGFVEFRNKEDAESAIKAMNGYKLAGHELMIRESNKAIDAAEERRKEDAVKKLSGQRTKIIIRNLPFEATKKDVRALFGPYGQLRTVRVPRKFDNSSQGFAFAEFVTSREAGNAVKSLTGVHLLGRRLNIEFAAGDALDAEEEIEKMSKKTRKQADKVAIQNLTGGGRKKFFVHQGEEDD